MTPFEQACKFSAQQEGGYSNDPVDRGGATNYGITQGIYTTFRRRRGLPPQPVTMITQNEVAVIKMEFWLEGKCDKLPDKVAVAHFDACFNSGPGNAARLLQRAVGAEPDGAIGPKTLAAVSKMVETSGENSVLSAMLRERELFLRAIVKTDPSQQRFINGWLNRVRAMERYFGIKNTF